jgi:putative restriction endonuclease
MAQMTKEELFRQLASLRKANFAGGGRSPYKPLLLLWALGQLKTVEINTFVYADVEQEISQLIDEFSPVRTNRYRAEMPFFYLEEELWDLTGDGELEPKRSVLRKNNATANLKPEVTTLLLSEEGLIEEAARFLVETHFTESYLEPIFAAIGLDFGVTRLPAFAVSIDQKKRDPKFRNAVLIAWRKQCAMCGYDGELANSSVGLEAAHVKWFSQGGPDELENGMALCELHHALFDLGVLGISATHRILVTEGFVGKSEASKRLVYDLHDTELREPAPNRPMPSLDFIGWHRTEVFREALVG